MVKKVTILIAIFMLQMVPLVVASESTTPIINFTDEYELDREFYFIYHTIYIAGDNFDIDTDYNVSLVNLPLINDTAIPESAPDTITMITSDSEGSLPNTIIWDQYDTTGGDYHPVGEYIIIIDINKPFFTNNICLTCILRMSREGNKIGFRKDHGNIKGW